MGLSNEDLNRIVERASTLTERSAGDFVPMEGNPALAKRRLAHWQLQSAGNDPWNFADLLKALGLQPDQEDRLLALLGGVKRERAAPLPAWAGLLSEMSADVAKHWESTADGENRLFDGLCCSLPYGHLLDSIGRFAWKRLQAVIASRTAVHLAPQSGLLTFLKRRVSRVTSLAMHEMFHAHTAIGASFMEPQPTRSTGEVSSDEQHHYRAFVLKQGREGLRNFFLIYPVAARLIAEVTQFWLEAAGEFFHRLEADRLELAEKFNQGSPLGKVTAIHPGLSDPHHRGRTVIILRFQTGQRLVYKPRPMRVDTLFGQLSEHLNATGLRLSLRAPEVLDRGEYGWMEYVRHEPCSDKQAARRFYRRTGSLTCLVHWLRGIDCHRDNFVAAGEHPMLIDLEALGHPDTTRPPLEEQAGSWRLDDSVLRTGLLPYWQLRPDGKRLYDNTALGAPTVQIPLGGSLRWENINTDRMNARWDQRPRRSLIHRPRVKTKALSARSYSADILAGYGDMAKLLDGTPGARCAPLRSLILSAARRHIRKPTVAYATLLRRSVRPEFLSEGIDRSLMLCGLLSEGTLGSDGLSAELAGLERLDIPYFQAAQIPGAKTLEVNLQNAGTELQRQSKLILDSLNRRLLLSEGRLVPLSPHRTSSAATKRVT